MKPFIFDIKNFNNENLNFKLPETRNNNIIIPIKHTTNKHLLFKTPKIYMPFKPNISNNQGGYLRLSFDNIKIDPDLKYFYDFINNIDNYLENKLINLNIIKNKNIHFKKTIKQSDGYPDYFNLNFTINEVNIYDSDLKLIPISEVNGNFYAYFVIELIGFYYNKKIKQAKLIWNLVQFKLDKPKKNIHECLFLDETDNTPQIIEPIKSHPLLEKFFKMLTIGIPRIAVEHKMNLSNINTKYLDYSPDTDINLLPLELKNYLIKPINNTINDNNNTNTNNTNTNNNNNIKLSISDIIKQNKLKNKIPKKNDIIKKTLRVPSLSEIQEARKKLFDKKDKKEEDKKEE